jgi:hypothetical protein
MAQQKVMLCAVCSIGRHISNTCGVLSKSSHHIKILGNYRIQHAESVTPSGTLLLFLDRIYIEEMLLCFSTVVIPYYSVCVICMHVTTVHVPTAAYSVTKQKYDTGDGGDINNAEQ